MYEFQILLLETISLQYMNPMINKGASQSSPKNPSTSRENTRFVFIVCYENLFGPRVLQLEDIHKTKHAPDFLPDFTWASITKVIQLAFASLLLQKCSGLPPSFYQSDHMLLSFL